MRHFQLKHEVETLAKLWNKNIDDMEEIITLHQSVYNFTLEEALDDLTELGGKSKMEIVHLSKIAKDQGELELVKTGMYFLDEAMGGGIQKGGSVVIAAMAGEGKTTFMQSLSYHIAKQNIPSLWFSYEENVNAIWARFKGMGLNDKHLMFAPMDLEDNKIDYIEEAIKKYKKKNKFFYVFIDQLSHIAPKVDGKTKVESLNSNFSLYLGIMSTQLKEIAMKHGIVVVIAHQLGRSGELAYSDMVRHAPDKVLFLEREKASEGGAERFTDKTFLKLNKNRPIGTSPIIPMRVIKNRFVHHASSELAEEAIETMDCKIKLDI